MIKVLFFVDTTLASGGAEKVLRTLVNNMDQTKFEITVQTAWQEDAEKYLVPGIRYRSLFSQKNKINRWRYRLEAMLGLLYPLRMKDNYDIEIAYLENGPTKVLASSTNSGAVKLAWVHCDLRKMTKDVESFRKKVKKWYAKYHKVVCVSETVRDAYVQLFGDAPEAVVVHNTVDSDEVLTKAAADLPAHIAKRKFTVATVGRLYKAKGYDRLLEAHKQLQDEGYDYDLWILGEGPDREEMERFIAKNGLQESVFLPGFQSNPYTFLAHADLVVCSSYYEGFSTVVTEALILGKPVVTTECSGMRELLGDSEYGLITENSTEGIYLGLKKLLDDRALLEAYGGLACKRGSSFRKETLVQKTEDFLMKELGVKNAR